MSATLIINVPGDNFTLHVEDFQHIVDYMNVSRFSGMRAVVVQGSPEVMIDAQTTQVRTLITK